MVVLLLDAGGTIEAGTVVVVVVSFVTTVGLSPPQPDRKPAPASTQAVRPARRNLRSAIMFISSKRFVYWPVPDWVVVVVVVEVAGGGVGGMIVVVWLSLATAPVLSW